MRLLAKKKGYPLGESNTSRKPGGKQEIAQTDGAKCGAPGAQTPPIAPDLQLIIEAWPTLSDAERAEVLANVAKAGVSGER